MHELETQLDLNYAYFSLYQSLDTAFPLRKYSSSNRRRNM